MTDTARRLHTAFLAALCCIVLAPSLAWSDDHTAHSATMSFKGSDEELAAFSWSGTPRPLAPGIMFETLMDRPAGDGDFVVAVNASSCETLGEQVGEGAGQMEIRFFDKARQLGLLARGSASIEAADCEGGPRTVTVKPGSGFSFQQP